MSNIHIMRMPENWLEWLGVVGSILTIISFGLYLFELFKRKKHDTLMLGFIHGVKPLVEVMAARPATTGADWQPLLQQINNMLARLQPPPSKVRVMVILVCILWIVTAAFYFVGRETSGDEMIFFRLLTAFFFIVALVSSLGTFIFWTDHHN